jgi:hypothetical protein
LGSTLIMRVLEIISNLVFVDEFIYETWKLTGSGLGKEEDSFGCGRGDAGFIVNVAEECYGDDCQEYRDEILHLLRISIKVNYKSYSSCQKTNKRGSPPPHLLSYYNCNHPQSIS